MNLNERNTLMRRNGELSIELADAKRLQAGAVSDCVELRDKISSIATELQESQRYNRALEYMMVMASDTERELRNTIHELETDFKARLKTISEACK